MCLIVFVFYDLTLAAIVLMLYEVLMGILAWSIIFSQQIETILQFCQQGRGDPKSYHRMFITRVAIKISTALKNSLKTVSSPTFLHFQSILH